MMKKYTLSQEWDLSPLGKKIDDPRFKKERKDTQKKTTAFAKKWSKDTSYLTDAKKLLQSLRQYEELVGDEDGDGNEGVLPVFALRIGNG